MYAARLGLRPLVLGHTHGTEAAIGGVITTTNLVENYPGFKKISGYELAKKIEDHARDYKEVEIKNEKAEELKKVKEGFYIKTNKGEYIGRTILFATGTKWKKLEVPGSNEFENRGLSYCALCDGPLYKGKVVGIVGGSDSAAKEALILAEHAKKVYMIYRGEKIRPEPINLKRIKQNKKIEIINKTNIKEIKGGDALKSVILDKEYNGKKELKLDGLFVAIGHSILSGLAPHLGVKINKKEEIIINHMTSETNVPGVFAAGDVTDKPFKQLIIGVADACTAAYYAYDYLTKEKL